ncbi:hypothetical protein JOM56_010480 [Amanita muscaria]
MEIFQTESQPVPGWQTDELQDEWIELPEETMESENDDYSKSRSISFTAPLQTHILTNSIIDKSPSSSPNRLVGTFLVREDIQHTPFLPKTPGRNKKVIKDFFTPLPLETMFEPPTPPERKPSTSLVQIPTVRSHSPEEEVLETDLPNVSPIQRRKPSTAYKFTFSVPREGFTTHIYPTGAPFPQAESTPNPPLTPHAPPGTDPRLRLFQFQYDTYTRDHLSAMVDSIAMNTPSASATGTTPSPTTCNPVLSRVSEVTTVDSSHLRSTKRVKLSPRTDFYGEGEGEKASISRPKLTARDYVGESRTLMQKIKQARDFSTISTVASARRGSSSSSEDENEGNQLEAPAPAETSRGPSFLEVPSNSTTNPASSTSTITSQSSASNKYRQQAAELMAQIKSDIKGHKRLYSGETCASRSSHDNKEAFQKRSALSNSTNRPPISLRSSTSSRNNSLRVSQSDSTANSTAIVNGLQHLTTAIARVSITDTHSNAPMQTSLSSRPPSRQHNSLRGGATPSYPSSSLRIGTTEDLNRFVSSSTASGTTLTAGSAPSFVKHPGPAHMRTIAPTDIPELPVRLGEMIFDKETMKWVKSVSRKASGGVDVGSATEGSEDPFGDIESLRDEMSRVSEESNPVQDSGQLSDDDGLMSRIEEQSEVDDEEMELTSFSTDASMRVVQVMTGVESGEYDDEHDPSAVVEEGDISEYRSEPLEENLQELVPSNAPDLPRETLQVLTPEAHANTPMRLGQSPSTVTPATRSVMKNSSATPASVLKNTNNRLQTPLQKAHRRSVSFSDGKKDGPIRGLNTTRPEIAGVSTNGTIVMSARSKRISDMMNALADEDSDFDATESPSRASSSGRPDDMRPLTERRPQQLAQVGVSRNRVFSRSYASQTSPGKHTTNKVNGTFLTECSFGVSHDRLVQVITDIQPFEPYWEELSSIDLSNKKLESVARLKEFLPQLDVLNLNSNQLSWLSGVPESIRTLSVACNCLTELTSYSHLANLEHLDISRNEVESLRQLACLRRLHELKVDGNKVTSLEGLERMDSLVKLSLHGNLISSVNFKHFKWTRLEMLNLSQNCLTDVQGMASLPSLIALNLDNNQVDELGTNGSMPKLRILRISGNKLQQLNAASFPNLRTLYADNNSLVNLVKLDRLSKLENLSLRNQRGRGLNIFTRDVRDVKRLYLSGNAIKNGFFEEHCYNLVYLELAACRLTALPEELALLVPNLRVLNLNYNFLEDVRALEGLTRLKKLSIIGSRLKRTKALIRLLQRMPEVEMLDFRMNPCTLGWYLPLLVRDVPGALQPSGGGWQELDRKFRRDLPDETYIGRLAYRGLVIRACPKVRMLDGVEMSEKERRKGQMVLEGILGCRSDGR